jgi:hypothetical protein
MPRTTTVAALRRRRGAVIGLIMLTAPTSMPGCAAFEHGHPGKRQVGPTPVTVCGIRLCTGDATWSMYGASVYNPGLRPYLSGMANPAGAVALAQSAGLNTIRVTDFLPRRGDASTAAYDPAAWRRVDTMIAAVGRAGMHVDLGLGDYRRILWDRCINPYTADWRDFMSFVANRTNTVTGVTYKHDATIALVSVSGEPLPVGAHNFVASATGVPCTITYSTQDLTTFYQSATTAWKQHGGSVLVSSGGLGYLNEPRSGIDWRTIFSLRTNDVCNVKTYGGMEAWIATAATFCGSIVKPIIDEEFGWRQSEGDEGRAQLFGRTFQELRSLHFAGAAFWNLGWEIAPTSYEVSPGTRATFAAVQQNAP